MTITSRSLFLRLFEGGEDDGSFRLASGVAVVEFEEDVSFDVEVSGEWFEPSVDLKTAARQLFSGTLETKRA